MAPASGAISICGDMFSQYPAEPLQQRSGIHREQGADALLRHLSFGSATPQGGTLPIMDRSDTANGIIGFLWQMTE
jgi:hypothetical protein